MYAMRDWQFFFLAIKGWVGGQRGGLCEGSCSCLSAASCLMPFIRNRFDTPRTVGLFCSGSHPDHAIEVAGCVDAIPKSCELIR